MRSVGVLALQGDVREHRAILERLGVESVSVKRPEELARVDGLVIPGGESTTIG
ncbi:MAG: pyridoxal 5'-phosphate synthase glutaminase subunit PdxT, partial [Acidimicrobiia bacterium]|nr:pyridoxal 5'-phosphate synthase glutaminase subunit PdxT [Acidimicrobiia bacterium]